MRKLLAILILFFAQPSGASELKPFVSDGCSLFPDGNLKDANAWCSCCIEHDLAYWQGGTKMEKEAADRALKRCVHKKTGNELLAKTMYEGVKYGGHPIFPNWYRWGYGWQYGRGFRALTPAELKQVKIELDRYRASEHHASCPDWNEHPLITP